MLLQEQVQDYEQVTAAHLLDLQFRGTGFAVGPADGYDSVAVAPDDRLERQLDGKVEVLGDERLGALDDLPTVTLERVGRVVVAKSKERLYEGVGEAVEQQFVLWIVDDPTPLYKARPKDALVAFFELAETPHHV